MPDLMVVAQQAQRAVVQLIDERRRIEFAMMRFDKPGAREIGKSMVHLYFDLFALHEQFDEIVGPGEPYFNPDYGMWFYDYDVIDDLGKAQAKLVSFWYALTGIRNAVHDLATGLEMLGIKKPILRHLLYHLNLIGELLKVDIERVTGTKL